MPKKSIRTKPATVYITQRHIKSFDESEIDFDLDSHFNLEKEDNVNYQHLTILDKGEDALVDNFPIQIDRMIAILNDLKKDGCNFIALDYHCDHIAYEVSGFIIELSTKEEFSNEKIRVSNKKAAQKEVDALIVKARKIAKEAGL